MFVFYSHSGIFRRLFQFGDMQAGAWWVSSIPPNTGALTTNNLRYKIMSRPLATLTIICAFLQVGVHAATDGIKHPAQPVNAVIEWNRTLLAIVRTPGAQPSTIHS